MVGPASVIHLLRWANGLAGCGLDVSVITLHEPLAGYDPRIEIVRLQPRAPFGYVLAALQLRRVLMARKPDIVNVHYASGYGTLAALSRHPKMVVSVWGKDVYEFPQRSFLHRRLLQHNLAAAIRVTSTSHAMKEVAQRFTDRPIDVVPFGVDTLLFQPPPQPGNDGRLVIGTVKTMARKYGIDTLLQATALLRADPTVPPFSLRIVGGGPDREALEKLMHTLAIGDITTFVGPVPYANVPRELCQLTIAAFPSREDSESFGCAAIEAMACGVPVVASDVDGFREVLDGGAFGVLVRRDDPQALALALRAMMLDPDRRRVLAAQGREAVARRFEWSACLDQMIAAYAEASRSSAHGGT
jgi:glycosyltransferase involved in cell wall biosynthesis